MTLGNSKGAIFITGASGGIGSACVRKFTEMGYLVFAGVRNKEKGIQLKKAISTAVVPIEIDITIPSSVQAAAKEVEKFLGNEGIVGLINNAGYIVQGPLELLSPEEIKHQFDVNVFGQITVTQAFLPLLRKVSGRIINVGAVTGKTTIPFLGAISASKHAMESITDAFRVELKPWNIHVSLIEPAAIQTEIFQKSTVDFNHSLKQVPAEKRSLYEKALEAIHSSMANQNASPIHVVVEAIVHAMTATKPHTRYAVGRGAGMFVALRLLPDKLRDKLISSSLRLNKTLN
ncbi:SDR family oxidoreductase [Bacillus sp. 03113]|uniref:SDR family oxidoreductase n=1 Tax=Bacillus sp. 03113 TaxID=2578211 RepID=UPI001141E006|nr:SDR family oxidoreductase [Bacillus sp. 03113]